MNEPFSSHAAGVGWRCGVCAWSQANKSKSIYQNSFVQLEESFVFQAAMMSLTVVRTVLGEFILI